MKIKEILTVVKNVLKQKNYLLLFIVLSVGSIYLFYVLADLFSLYYLNPLYFVIITTALTFFIAVLLALNLTLIVYDFRQARLASYKEGATGISGAVLGTVASGCPVCGATVLGFFGLSGALSVLPLKGIELKALGLGLLLVSTYHVSKKINNKCKICKFK